MLNTEPSSAQVYFNMSHKLTPLLIKKGLKKKNIETWLIDKEMEKDIEKLGMLFGILEAPLLKDNNKIKKVIQNLIGDYYQSNLDLTKTIDLESHFEKNIKEFDRALKETLEDKTNKKLLNALLGVYHHNKLYFTYTGKMQGWLIHKKEKADYELLNILDHNEKNEECSSSYFTHIFIGTMTSEDSIIFATANLTTYLEANNLKKIIAFLPTLSLEEHIKNLLEPERQIELASLIIKATHQSLFKFPKQFSSYLLKTKNYSEDSLEKLINIQKKTQRLLGPALGLNFKKNFFNTISFLKKIYHYLKEKALNYSPFFQIIWGELLYHFKRLLFKYLPFLFSQEIKKYKEVKKEILLKERIKNWYKKLSPLNQGLFITILILFLFFTGSLLILSIKQYQEQKVAGYNNLINEIQGKQNAVLSALIYKDELKAQNILEDLDQLIKKMPQRTRKQKEKVSIIVKENQLLKEKLSHLEKANIVLVFNLGKQGINHLKGVLKIDNNLYLYNAQIYRLNLKNKKVERSFTSPLPQLESAKIRTRDSILFLGKTKNFYEFIVSQNTFRPMPVMSLPPVSDFAIYNERLYILNSQNNQILKFQKRKEGFGEGKNWSLKKNIDLTRAISFAIDGSIYVLNNDRTILKLDQGKKTDFMTLLSTSPLSKGAKIFTSSFTKNIYILDNTNQKLIIIDKKGGLFKQLYHEDFKDLKDFAVDEKEKQIYLLINDSVYQTPL